MSENDVRRIEDKVDALAIGFARLEGSLSPTISKMTERQDDTDKVVADHEGRLRSLERFRYAIPTASVVSALAAVGALIYVFLPGGHP